MTKRAPMIAPAPSSPLPERYEDALVELERLVQAMETGQMPLDQLLDSYRRGAALMGHCRAQLQAVETQVKVLEDGQLGEWVNP
jgi:exodeoxyribonuclease VII small subunit